MSISAITERPPVLQRNRLTVPWSTVLPLAIVLAFADGFWLTSLRGAVGAIERTQSPFTDWWRGSIVVVPFFVVAVLGAMTLALRWFGPTLRKPSTVVATVLLIVAAGTVVGIAEMVASSAYDYHLQSIQLRTMNAMGSLCNTNCLAQQQHDTLAVHVRGVLCVSRWLLLTNLVLVSWLVAMRGGRLKVGTASRRPAVAGAWRETSSRLKDMRIVLAATLVAAATIHAAVVPEHLAEWTAAGVFFVLLTAAEVGVAGLLFTRVRQQTVLLAAVAISIGPLLIWLYSRTAGLPFGPGAGTPEAIGLPDIVACAMEIMSLIVAVVLTRSAGRLTVRPATSPHVMGIALVTLTAVTAIGLTGTDVSWLNVLNTGSSSVMNMSH